MEVSKLFEGLERFTSVRDADDLAKAMRRYADDLGFSSFIYALRVPESFSSARVLQVKGYPDAWLDRYWERGYFAIDPVIEYCSHNIVPMAWDRLVPRMSAAGRRMMLEAGEFGLADGASMAVHGPEGELGILSFARVRGRPRTDTDRRHTLGVTQLVAAHAHEAVRRVFDIGAPTAKLSRREVECLSWAAEGKTSWEISLLLTISERTVNFHLDNAVAKLRASNRQHAIARAIASGMLRPSPF